MLLVLLSRKQGPPTSQAFPSRNYQGCMTRRENPQSKSPSLIQLIAELLQAAGREPSLGLDVKSEAMAVGYLLAVHKIPQGNLRYRSAALTDDNVVEDLSAAESIAEEARSAATDACFSEPPTSSFAETIPSIRELRQAAGRPSCNRLFREAVRARMA